MASTSDDVSEKVAASTSIDNDSVMTKYTVACDIANSTTTLHPPPVVVCRSLPAPLPLPPACRRRWVPCVSGFDTLFPFASFSH